MTTTFYIERETLTHSEIKRRIAIAAEHDCHFHYVAKADDGAPKSWFTGHNAGAPFDDNRTQSVAAEIKGGDDR
jgi:hypothetical protein